jgi:fimbrial chaperone protein
MFTASPVLRFMTFSLLVFGITATAQAASLSISPIVVTLDEKRQTAALTLKNESSETRVVQTELLRWTQKNGANVHAPSRDILVNPPIATLHPGQTQIIRIGLNRKVDKTQELAYRLYISEVPPPPKEGFTGLNIALRLGLAVFVPPRAKLTDKLDWKAVRNQKGDLQLTLRNGGNRHLRLISLEVRDPDDGRQLAELQQPLPTLLAEQTRQLSLSLPTDWQGKDVRLVASTEDGLVESRIKLEQAAR